MALFGKKGLRIEVVDGIDIESGVTLSGDKVTIGTGESDTLRLGEADVVPAQVTLQRKGSDWDYFVSDRGRTVISRGHPRAGRLAAGQEFRLGGSARLVVKRTDAAPPAAAGAPEKTTIPLVIVLPVLALIVLGVFAAMSALRREETAGPLLATSRWFTRAEPLDAALDACLAVAGTQDGVPVARTAPDWAFRSWAAAPDKTAPEAQAARADLLAFVEDAIARAHFLHDAGENAEASELYRRIEYAIPLGTRSCPILAATRRDLAVLELMGNRN
jgi:hypothetical protein